MSRKIDVHVDGFEAQIITDMWCSGSAISFDIDDAKWKDAIDNEDPDIFDTLQTMMYHGTQVQALHRIYDMHRYLHMYEGSFRGINNFLDRYTNAELRVAAMTVIEGDSPLISDKGISMAKVILTVADGTYVPPPLPEKTVEEKRLAKFRNARHKLQLAVTIRDTFKCSQCEDNTKGALCLAKKDYSNPEYSEDNLIFVCRKCLPKYKKKNMK